MSGRIHHSYPIENLFDWPQGYIEIPLDWTPAQADEMVTILGRIEEKIWTLYGDELVELARYESLEDDRTEDMLTVAGYLEDDIPF